MLGWSSVLLVLGLCSPMSAAEEVSVAYELADQPGGDGSAGHWRVTVRVAGLRPEDGPPGFTSMGSRRPDGWPPLEVLESEPPVAAREADGRTLTLQLPVDWDGSATLVYRLALTPIGSEDHRRFDRAPARGDGFAYGNSLEVLLRPTQGGAFVEAEVETTISASTPDGTVVTGWGGKASGRQVVRPAPAWGSSPIAFGAPRFTADVTRDGFAVEVFQFRGPDGTAHVAELVHLLGPAMARATGWPARSPSRVFLTDAMGGGMGSDFGLHMNVPPDAAPGFEFDPWFETTVAHELFHEWLGIRLHESRGSLVWFREGFTEYFAQWFCAALGVTSREFFASTLDEFDRFARDRTSFGRVPFARPGVNWRDGNGPNELMAYRGGPVLALALDVELREAGRGGLLQLIRDLLARDDHVFPPDELRAWFVQNGLEEVWATGVAGVEVPTAGESLERAGFESTEVPVDVAYLGLHTVEEKPIWRVLGVDPEGPGAAAGVLVGDVVEGFFPFNGAPTTLQDLSTPYTFGLAIFTPGIEGSFLEVRRDGDLLRLAVEPELRPWGLRTEWRAADDVDRFFAFEPR